VVECGLTGDCLDPCCSGLTQEQKAAVVQLVDCKSDECVMPCSGVAEFTGICQ
jgi:hypothetical protein